MAPSAGTPSPVAIHCSIAPKEYTSLRASTLALSPAACSGAMNPAVPSTALSAVLQVGSIPDDLREPPVHHQHFAKSADHHVLGLQIPVHHSLRMRESDGIGDAEEEPQPLGERYRPRQARVESLSLHPLHRVED